MSKAPGTFWQHVFGNQGGLAGGGRGDGGPSSIDDIKQTVESVDICIVDGTVNYFELERCEEGSPCPACKCSQMDCLQRTPTITVVSSFVKSGIPVLVYSVTTYEPRLLKQSHSDWLEIIVKNLDFNPWSQGKDNPIKLDYPVVGGILSCVEADKDEDIIDS